MFRRLAPGWAAVALLAAGCSSGSSPSLDAGQDAGIDAGSDGGDNMEPLADGGCSMVGEPCDPELPCCDLVDDYCNASESICLPLVTGGSTGGSGGSTGGSTGGTSGGLPSDGTGWHEEAVIASVGSLNALSVPSPALQLAAGSGPGLGQVVLRSADAGWATVSAVPDTNGFSSLWVDAAGDLFATGMGDGGVPILLGGTFDGGIQVIPLPLNSDGGPLFSTLASVVGFGPNEALAVGSPATIALHLLPDAGFILELLPTTVELTSVYKLIGTSSGRIFALATANLSSLPAWVLVRADGGWTQLPEIFDAANLADLTIGPSGDVTAVGDDGSGHGLVYVLTDAGFTQVTTFPAVPPLSAVCEPQTGEFFFASAPTTSGAEMIYVDGGLSTVDSGLVIGGFWSELLPSDAQRINAIASDGAGNLFAVGVRECTLCSGLPLALVRDP